MAVAPMCRVCGKREWRHTCGGVPVAGEPLREAMRRFPEIKISGGDLSAKVTGRGQPEEPVRHEPVGTREDNWSAKPLTAPAGECEYCDRRRAYARAAMRRRRAK